MTTRAKAAAKSTSPAHYRQPTHSACATLRIVPDSRIFTGLLRDRQSCRDLKMAARHGHAAKLEALGRWRARADQRGIPKSSCSCCDHLLDRLRGYLIASRGLLAASVGGHALAARAG